MYVTGAVREGPLSDTITEFGIDAARIAMFFFAPSDEDIRWADSGAFGARKFCQRRRLIRRAGQRAAKDNV